jgi:signal peptidase I
MLPPVLTYVQPAAEPTAGDRSAARRGAGCLLEIVETILLTLVIYLVIHNFVAQPFEVEQNSMVTTIQPGDYVLIDKLTPHFDEYDRGDIVVFQPPEGYEQGGVPFIKRVIGLPGETVTLRRGHVFIDGKRLEESYLPKGTVTQPICGSVTEFKVPKDEVFVLGDNRGNSTDGRCFGPIDEDTIVGRAFFRFWPLSQLDWL